MPKIFFLSDNVLTALLDGVRAAGNDNIHVKTKPTDRGLRLLPYTSCLDEDTESQQTRLLFSPPRKSFKSRKLFETEKFLIFWFSSWNETVRRPSPV